jgi:hypothetical protein
MNVKGRHRGIEEWSKCSDGRHGLFAIKIKTEN